MSSRLIIACTLLYVSVPLLAAEQAAPFTVKSLREVPSGRYVTEPDHTRVLWSIPHHGYSRFTAILPKISGVLMLDSQRIENSVVEVEIDMAAAVSGIEVFDERMKDPQWQIFSSRQFPKAMFRSTSVRRRDARRFTITGDLTFLGITKPITLEATFNQAGTANGVPPGYRVGFDATATMQRGDWGHSSRPTLGNEVQLQIEAEFLNAYTSTTTGVSP